MELTGKKIIAADIATVWAHLNNPETLKARIPGCEALTRSSIDGFSATVEQKVGPVKATFQGEVTLQNIVIGESHTIAGEGKGGVASFAKGGADVKLRAIDEGCELTYNATAKVGGKIAQLGSRVIGGFARKMADQFFDNFQATVEGKFD